MKETMNLIIQKARQISCRRGELYRIYLTEGQNVEESKYLANFSALHTLLYHI